jgi:hemolysin activation/secretion protein
VAELTRARHQSVNLFEPHAATIPHLPAGRNVRFHEQPTAGARHPSLGDSRTPIRRAAAAVLAALVAAQLVPAHGRADEPGPKAGRTLDVFEFRVEGASRLSAEEIEAAVHPFLGPVRPLEDVEKARAALEKAYSDKGYQSVAVAIPPQTVRGGVVTLNVTEPRVGRLRVRGARWFVPSELRKLAPSMEEGTVPNFNDVVRDVVAMNQLADRRVTPALRAGRVPGTVDIDLDVQDHLPLHASLEVNDRHGRDTTPVRTTASVRYDNLWQLGHTLSLSAQLAPERLDDARVFSGSYTARFAEVPWLSVLASYVEHGSDITTVGEINVVGRGRTAGARLQATFPGGAGFVQVVSAGVDVKRLRDRIGPDDSQLITYVPLGAQYTASWAGDGSQTQLVASVTTNLRGLSSRQERFDDKRESGAASFAIARAEASRTDRLPLGLELALRVQGQYSADPLVGAEQLGAGGAESVRGYLESEAVGDHGGLASIELRSPSLGRLFGRRIADEWRFHAFAEGAALAVHRPLPEQHAANTLSSFGGGTQLEVRRWLGASFDVGFPLESGESSRWMEPRFHFRTWTEF